MMEFRVGRVTERDAATARVRVTFDATDSLVSYWLPVLQAKTLADKVYWMPDVDEHVVCLLDKHAEFGVVMGAIFSSVDQPPVANLDALHVRFKDGSTLEYDRTEHQLRVHVVSGDLHLQVDDGHHVHIGGDAGEELATKSFVQQQYNLHTHIAGSPGSPTSPPVQPAPAVPGEDVTKKLKSE